MKPFAIFVTILLIVASLSLVVWVGRYKGSLAVNKTPAGADPGHAGDELLPLPKDGPFGKMDLSEVEHDFGTKRVGSQSEHTFTIKNIGEGPLELKMGQPSCQCTVGEISKVNESGEAVASAGAEKPAEKKVENEAPKSDEEKRKAEAAKHVGENVTLAPNESVNIRVKWVMKGETEKFRQHVPIYTTDAKYRKVDLVITGVVETPIQMVPAGLWDLGEMVKGEPAKGEGLIFSTTLENFSVEQVPKDNSKVTLTFEPASEADLSAKHAKSGYRIVAEISPDISIGMLRELVKIKAVYEKSDLDKEKDANKKPADGDQDGKAAGDKEEVSHEFTVQIRRSGPIEFRGVTGASFVPTSNRLIIPDFPATEARKVKLTAIVKNQDEDLQIKSVESPDNRVAATISAPKPFGNSKSYQIEIEILPGPAGRHRDLEAMPIHLFLNHPDAPDIKMFIDYNATH